MGKKNLEKKERNEELYRLHLEGESFGTLGKKYKITRGRVSAIFYKIQKKNK